LKRSPLSRPWSWGSPWPTSCGSTFIAAYVCFRLPPMISDKNTSSSYLQSYGDYNKLPCPPIYPVIGTAYVIPSDRTLIETVVAGHTIKYRNKYGAYAMWYVVTQKKLKKSLTPVTAGWEPSPCCSPPTPPSTKRSCVSGFNLFIYLCLFHSLVQAHHQGLLLHRAAPVAGPGPAHVRGPDVARPPPHDHALVPL